MNRSYYPVIIELASILSFLAIWQIVVTFNFVNPAFLASPSQVWSVFYDSAAVQKVSRGLDLLGYEVVGAFLLSLATAIPIGFAIGSNRFLHDSLDPYVVLFYTFPKIAAFPAIALVFGLGATTNIVFGAVSGSSIVLFNTIHARRGVDDSVIKVAKSVGCNRIKIYQSVIVPSITPALFGTIRLGLLRSFAGVLESELLVPFLGIGLLINQYTFAFKTPQLYFTIVVVSLVVVAINFALLAWENRIGRWMK